MRTNVMKKDIWRRWGVVPEETELFYALDRQKDWGMTLKIPKELEADAEMRMIWPELVLDEEDISGEVYGLRFSDREDPSVVQLAFGYFDVHNREFYLTETDDRSDPTVMTALINGAEAAVLIRRQHRGMISDRFCVTGSYAPRLSRKASGQRYTSYLAIFPMVTELWPMRREALLRSSHQEVAADFYERRGALRSEVLGMCAEMKARQWEVVLGPGTIEVSIPLSQEYGRKKATRCDLVLDYTKDSVAALRSFVNSARAGVYDSRLGVGDSGRFYSTEHNAMIRWYAPMPEPKTVEKEVGLEPASWIPKAKREMS